MYTIKWRVLKKVAGEQTTGEESQRFHTEEEAKTRATILNQVWSPDIIHWVEEVNKDEFEKLPYYVKRAEALGVIEIVQKKIERMYATISVHSDDAKALRQTISLTKDVLLHNSKIDTQNDIEIFEVSVRNAGDLFDLGVMFRQHCINILIEGTKEILNELEDGNHPHR